jgi:hypothetical protein
MHRLFPCFARYACPVLQNHLHRAQPGRSSGDARRCLGACGAREAHPGGPPSFTSHNKKEHKRTLRKEASQTECLSQNIPCASPLIKSAPTGFPKGLALTTLDMQCAMQEVTEMAVLGQEVACLHSIMQACSK